LSLILIFVVGDGVSYNALKSWIVDSVVMFLRSFDMFSVIVLLFCLVFSIGTPFFMSLLIYSLIDDSLRLSCVARVRYLISL